MKVNHLVPMLETEDLQATIRFYRDVLGFEVRGFYPDEENACWASFWSGNLEIGFGNKNLRNDIPGTVMTGSLYIHVANVDELWEVEGKAEVMFAPQDMNYMMREFGIKDPNGYAIIIGQDISNKEGA